MEALASRSPNVLGRKKTVMTKESLDAQRKEKLEAAAAAAKKTQKDREHPPQPPEYVVEPNGPGGEPGERYKTGNLLGKGGFAICYKGELCDKRHGNTINQFALKIVKSKMSQKRLTEKVGCSLCLARSQANVPIPVPHRVANPLETSAPKHC